ncbi:MAG: ABC transporter ATP-binding protein [Acidobacteriota bacterium]
MIELRGIERTYQVGHSQVHALCDVRLSLPDHSYLSLMGPSGSGKSTLLNILGLLDKPTAGSYSLDGRETVSLDDATITRLRRHTIGFVFQTFHLVPRLTARGNIELPMIFAGVPRHERRARAESALESVGLSHRATHRQAELSGGERQRVAIARAIVMQPTLLLADEPTGNLDQTSGDEIIARLESLHTGGITLIVVTHDPSVGGRASRRIRVRDGRLAAETA